MSSDPNYDTATGAAAAAQRAIAEGAQLILGPLLADDVRAVAPIARAAIEARSARASAARLWGTVTLTPANPPAPSERTRSANSLGATSIA